MISLKFKPLKKAVAIAAVILAVAVTGQETALWTIHNFWVYEVFAVVMLFALGMIFRVSNTLAMNEGRQRAGEASAILGVAGYAVGAIVAPLVGLGNVFHSTAIVFVALMVCIVTMSVLSSRLAPDLDN